MTAKKEKVRRMVHGVEKEIWDKALNHGRLTLGITGKVLLETLLIEFLKDVEYLNKEKILREAGVETNSSYSPSVLKRIAENLKATGILKDIKKLEEQ